MSAAPRGSLLLNTASLPSWAHIDVPTQADSEELCMRLMYQSALREHLKAATAKVTRNSEISEEERAYSRRVLTSLIEPWASTRRFLAENAELDEGAIRRSAIETLRPILAAERAAEAQHVESVTERRLRETLAAKVARRERDAKAEPKVLKPKPVPAPTRLWDSADLLRFLAEHESRLDPAELEQGLAEVECRAKRERHMEYARRWRAAQKAERESVPALAAE